MSENKKRKQRPVRTIGTNVGQMILEAQEREIARRKAVQAEALRKLRGGK